ncbi:MAG: 50S ribosomal protein L6 [Sphaerochaetaceae bacterium]|jgi:large subunit ribosomal protein L6|nr:50S ribosomal protein L6 [Sphaerochaetaceae bacterium]MDD4006448.1 50S ribosomal protein L6 [Sphaerochaetaceae bacterium]
MSRIGKLPIDLPKGVEVSQANGLITVKGPKGTLTQKERTEVAIEIDKNEIHVTRTDDSNESNAYHGLYRMLIHNMIEGVTKGYSKSLTINGVGYRADLKGNLLVLTLGYSSIIEYVIPKGIEITCDSPNKIKVSGINKQQVGQVSAEIRGLRGPEPYKGKGIKYDTEVIRRKVGKTGGKK